MAKSALTQLQEQIEAVRREAFAAGYEAAMQAVRDVASRPTPSVGEAMPLHRAPLARPPAGAGRRRRGSGSRPPRGSNAQLVEEVLQAIAPRDARPAEIRSALQRDKGVAMAFTSIRHALGQLEARHVVEQLPDSKSWRHTG